MRQVEIEEMVMSHAMTGSDDDEAAVEEAFQTVVPNQDVARFHLRVAVVHDDAVVAIRIDIARAMIDAGVTANLTIVEAVEIDAFAVHFLECVVAVLGGVGVASRVDGCGSCFGFAVHCINGIADFDTGVLLNQHTGCMADLNSIASHARDLVEGDPAIGIARGLQKRVRPDRVAEHVAEFRSGDFEVVRALFEQDASGGVIALTGVARSALADMGECDMDLAGGANQDRKPGNVLERKIFEPDGAALFDEDAVVARERGEGDIGRSQVLSSMMDAIAVAIDGEALNPDVVPAGDDKRCAALKVRRELKRGVASINV